jgi:hypothetical protein
LAGGEESHAAQEINTAASPARLELAIPKTDRKEIFI